MKSKYLSLTLIFACSIIFPCMAHAQATGSISGNMTDASGAAIPGAKVTITDTDTNTPRVLATDSAGRFVANLLSLGNYAIQIAAPNFQEAIKKGILLEAQGSPEIDFTLVPASVSSKISVQANPVEVQTTDATLSQVIHARQVADLPLNGRNFVELASLAPGVSAGDQPQDFLSEVQVTVAKWQSVAPFLCPWVDRERTGRIGCTMGSTIMN